MLKLICDHEDKNSEKKNSHVKIEVIMRSQKVKKNIFMLKLICDHEDHSSEKNIFML